MKAKWNKEETKDSWCRIPGNEDVVVGLWFVSLHFFLLIYNGIERKWNVSMKWAKEMKEREPHNKSFISHSGWSRVHSFLSLLSFSFSLSLQANEKSAWMKGKERKKKRKELTTHEPQPPTADTTLSKL